jgi:hypothetical protein
MKTTLKETIKEVIKDILRESEQHQTDEMYTYKGKKYPVWVDDEHNRFIKVNGQIIDIDNESVIKEDVLKETFKGMHPINKWYENDPYKLMTVVYWRKRSIPPRDARQWDVQWQSIARQLNQKFPVPNDKRYLLTFKMGDKVK